MLKGSGLESSGVVSLAVGMSLRNVVEGIRLSMRGSTDMGTHGHIRGFAGKVKTGCPLTPSLPLLVLQGPVRRTGMGPRTGPDRNQFKWTNGPGPYNFFEKDRKRPQS